MHAWVGRLARISRDGISSYTASGPIRSPLGGWLLVALPALTGALPELGQRLGVWLPNPGWIARERPGRRGGFGRPRPLYLFRELLGRNRVDGRYLFVTDSRHAGVRAGPGGGVGSATCPAYVDPEWRCAPLQCGGLRPGVSQPGLGSRRCPPPLQKEGSNRDRGWRHDHTHTAR
jgi:hypothetical protein